MIKNSFDFTPFDKLGAGRGLRRDISCQLSVFSEGKSKIFEL